ncbi:MAG: polysaccharide deacetylase family protein [Lachnospiraceae bacterium]
MNDNPIVGIKEQQRRRRRINRIKSAILWFFLIWIIFTVTACVILGIRVASLNKKINKIYDYLTTSSSDAQITEEDYADLTGELPVDEDEIRNYNTDSDNQVVDKDSRKVYLTFDDGPSDNTDEILDILKEYGIKATFFVVGKTDENSRQMYKRIVEEGHTIALHSYSHKYSEIYSSVEKFKNDLDKLNKLIREETGVNTYFLRFPGGSSNQVSDVDMKEFIKMATEEGYTYFDWNVVSGDATSGSYTAKDLVNNVVTGVENYQESIVLMHDASDKDSTVEALPKMIEKLKSEGYQMLPIDDDTKIIQHVSVESVVNE